MGKITVKNISSGTTVLSVPEINFNRSLMPGREVPVTQEQYDSLLFDPGVQTLVRAGYIKFFGTDEGEQVEVNEASIKEKSEIEAMIAKRDITAFSRFIPNASPAAKDTIVKYAVENNVVDNAFTALIKKYCGVDVISAITIKHQAEEK